MTRLLAPFDRLQAQPAAMKKIREKVKIFFSIFSIEIILRECRLRNPRNYTLGPTVSAIGERTSGLTDKFR